jgi:predicted DNA-binding transcriptional regulator AlpA
MTREEMVTLPAVLDVPTAARVLGVGRSAAYELVRSGAWPTPVIRLGKLIKIPTAPLLTLVGVVHEQVGDRDVRSAS